MTVHSGMKGLVWYSCNICGLRLSLATKLKIHSLIHTGERPDACRVCHKQYRTAKALNIHMLVHSKKVPHNCFICGRGFSCANSLKRHLESQGKQRNTVCNDDTWTTVHAKLLSKFTLCWNLHI